jgi:hypothetical protein
LKEKNQVLILVLVLVLEIRPGSRKLVWNWFSKIMVLVPELDLVLNLVPVPEIRPHSSSDFTNWNQDWQF